MIRFTNLITEKHLNSSISGEERNRGEKKQRIKSEHQKDRTKFEFWILQVAHISLNEYI